MNEVISEVTSKKKRVPTQLKQLAEKRARIAGQILRFQAKVNQRGRVIDSLSKKLEEAIRDRDLAINKVAFLSIELQHCDETIKTRYPTINPANIDPIQGTKGGYGQSDSLRAAILSSLMGAKPGFLSMREIGNFVIARCSLVLNNDEARHRWERNSLRRALQKLVDAGRLEMIDGRRENKLSTWRIREETQLSLSQLPD